MKILMVCLGNICRSPLAQGILEEKVKKYGLDWTVDSAGTSGFHIGQRPDLRSIEIGRWHGIDISGQRARMIQQEDLDRFDFILTMDESNFEDVLAMCTDDEQRQKVQLVMHHGENPEIEEVPDPYYGGQSGFQEVYELLDEALENFVRQVMIAKDDK